MANTSCVDGHDDEVENFHCSHVEMQDECLEHPIAYIARHDPDTLYLNQALKAPDRKQFIKAMKDEIQQNEELGHWELVKKRDIPAGTKILQAVWAMKRKRRIDTREVYKWKARLNVHGGQQEYGEHHTKKYSPVIGWSTIRLFLILSVIFGWRTRQIDFVLAYPQADIEKPLYMELQSGIKSDVNRNDYCLKLLKNLYGQKQAGRVWNEHLIKGLMDMRFQQSKVDECLLYRGSLALLIYVDDTIICSKYKDVRGSTSKTSVTSRIFWDKLTAVFKTSDNTFALVNQQYFIRQEGVSDIRARLIIPCTTHL